MKQVKMKNYTKMQVEELEAELISRMLDPSGLKPALVARLLIANLNAITPLDDPLSILEPRAIELGNLRRPDLQEILLSFDVRPAGLKADLIAQVILVERGLNRYAIGHCFPEAWLLNTCSVHLDLRTYQKPRSPKRLAVRPLHSNRTRFPRVPSLIDRQLLRKGLLPCPLPSLLREQSLIRAFVEWELPYRRRRPCGLTSINVFSLQRQSHQYSLKYERRAYARLLLTRC